jgi:hypothetical protein
MDDADAVILKITLHHGQRLGSRPESAIDLLWQRLMAGQKGTSFARRGSEIRATWESTAPRAVPRGELNAIARAAVLELVRDTCERAPELEFGWFAVSPL